MTDITIPRDEWFALQEQIDKLKKERDYLFNAMNAIANEDNSAVATADEYADMVLQDMNSKTRIRKKIKR